jgi:hypothetical protein
MTKAEQYLYRRINRRLRPEGQQLHLSTARQVSNLENYFITDDHTGQVTAWFISDLPALLEEILGKDEFEQECEHNALLRDAWAAVGMGWSTSVGLSRSEHFGLDSGRSAPQGRLLDLGPSPSKRRTGRD